MITQAWPGFLVGKVEPSSLLATGNNFYIDRINISNNPLGVNEMILGQRQVAVAPNPTSSNAYLIFRQAWEHIDVMVTDIAGKTVYRVNGRVDDQNGRMEIPAAVLTVKGVYLVHISGDGGLQQTEKLVVY